MVLKKEQQIINIGLGALVPLLTFVLGWWLSASLIIYKVIQLSEFFIIFCAATGLIIGVFFDIFYLKKLVFAFYSIKSFYLIPVYLFCSLIAVAFFMGLPVANLLLGTIAGLYTGRKFSNTNPDCEKFSTAAIKTGYFTAFVTSIEAFFLGLFALHDISIIAGLLSLLQLKLNFSYLILDIILVLLLCLLLFFIQFWLTKIAAKYAFRI